MASERLFSQFFQAGFECSSHRLRNGKRLDLIHATQHDTLAAADYRRLHEYGITTVRDGIRWHMIEQQAGNYDWRSVLPMVRAAQASGTQVIWDLCHYGWPDDLDILGPEFVPRFAAFADAFAQLLARETDTTPFYVPVNEISFFAWAAGDAGYLNPFCTGRSFELKVQLVRATLAAIDAVWNVDSSARIVHAEPLIHVVAAPDRPWDYNAAEGHRQAQFQAWDMISGRMWPQLGGHQRYLDILGINYYPNNQWIHGGPHQYRFDQQYRPLHDMLREVHKRYQRPLFIAETGCEDGERPEWLRYIGREVRSAIRLGVPVEGVCLYPILNHPGWDDDRHCHNGLFDYPNAQGDREVYAPLAQELRTQQALIEPRRRSRPIKARDSVLPSLCLYTDSRNPSGMGEVMLTQAKQLRHTYRITIVCPPSINGTAMLEQAAALGIPTLALPEDHHTAAEYLRDWLRMHQVDIFHTHAGIGWEGHQAAYIAHAIGVPVVVRTEHLPYLVTEPQQRADHTQLLQVLDQFVCVSNAAQQTFLEAGVPAARLRVIRNGIVPRQSHTARQTTRAQLGYTNQESIMLTVGRMTEQKGYDLLLEAVPLVLAQHPGARFVWVGEGPLLTELHIAIHNAGLDHIIRILGHRADIADLLAAANVFVLPSRFEGLPLVVLEAMAAGLPVLGTQVCGTSEAVEEGVTGRLVAPEQPYALAAALIDMLNDTERLVQWGTAGLIRANHEFSADRMVQETVSLYRALLNHD